MFRIYKIILFFLFGICHPSDQLSSATNTSSLPIVMWHGMGDSCCFSFSMGRIQNYITDEIPGLYIKSIRIGDNEIEDVANSYIGHINQQVEQVCDELSKDEKLQHGYNAIGFSQGSQFLRAIAERCPNPPMYNLVSIGGQHQGIYGLPNCRSTHYKFCDYIRQILNYAAYTKFVQENIIQAGFWHDPLQEEEYKSKNLFLADINNELHINETYKLNLKNLKNIVLVKFEYDETVQPIESEWFGFYKPGQSIEIEKLEDSKLYQEDRLGLKEMNEAGKLSFLSVPGHHLQFTEEWFSENIIKKYLV